MPRREPTPGLARYRELKALHPHWENDRLWREAGVEPSGRMPLWAEHGPAQNPASYRRDPREK